MPRPYITIASGFDRMTAPILPEALAVLASTPVVLRALLASHDAATIESPNADGWSTKDVVAHILDAEGIAFADRMQAILDRDRPYITSIDPPARLDALGYRTRTLADLLADLERQRAEHIVWLRALTPAQLGRAGEHDHAGEITVADIAHQWAYHDLQHLQQIAQMLQSPLVTRMGNTRKFYDV